MKPSEVLILSNPKNRQNLIHGSGLRLDLSWMVILGFILLTTFCLVLHLGHLLRAVFPGGAFLVGLFLYYRHVILYTGFTWWLAFLTPWVRRLIDLQSGWQDPSPVLLAPFVTMLISGLAFIWYLPRSLREGAFPLLLTTFSVIYGLLVGLIYQSPTAVFVAALNWLAPILFCFHIFINWRDYPSYRHNFQRVFLWGILISGSYGVYQFLTAPPWDQFWMQNAPMNTIGSPVPFQIRVFSTMNSPGPFSVVILAGLLLLLSSQTVLQIPAASIGYLSLLLSQVRSSWLSWVIGLLLLIPSLKPKFQIRLVTTLLIIVLCIIPIAVSEPFSGLISSRLQTFLNPQQDTSFIERTGGYEVAFTSAMAEPFGQGLGFVLRGTTLGINDSGIL